MRKALSPQFIITVAVVVILSLTACGPCGLSGLILRPTDTPVPPTPAPSPTPPSTSTPSPTPTPLSQDIIQAVEAEEQLLVNIYKRVAPSVVHIQVEIQRGLMGGTGSGFVYDKEGHIITNNHVVENASRIIVSFSDETDAEATLVGADPYSDLAVIKVDVPPDKLHPVELGSSADLQVGQRAIAIGNPFGRFERSMTVGIISALGRVLTGESRFGNPNLIQTDAAINPGNSGGPLLDSQGRVIGVTTMIYSRSGTSSGVGFAVPVDVVKRVVPQLIERGYYPHPWLGIEGRSITTHTAEVLNLPVKRGAEIIRVMPDGPAEKAGLRGGTHQVLLEGEPIETGGDIIVAFDGQPVYSMDDLITYVDNAEVGQTVELTVIRDGKEITIPVTLGERPRR